MKDSVIKPVKLIIEGLMIIGGLLFILAILTISIDTGMLDDEVDVYDMEEKQPAVQETESEKKTKRLTIPGRKYAEIPHGKNRNVF